MDPTLVLIVGGGLALLFLVVGIVLSFVGGGSIVEERLGRYAETGGLVTTDSEQLAGGDEAGTSALSDFLNNLGEGTDLFAKISTNLAQADIKLRPAEYLAARVIAMFVGGVIAFALSGVIFAVVGAIVGFFIPPIYVGRAKKGRLKAFDNQLADMLNLIVNGLRAGFSTMQALEAVG
ncbi:MAG: hypothetical protein V3U32_07835, partial [Anaerolineales bacterium]